MDQSKGRAMVAAMVVITAGCGGGSGTVIKTPTDGAAFCRQLAGLMSDKDACFLASQTLLTAQRDADASCARVAAALTAGRITYDPQQATACLNAVHAMPCGSGFTYDQVHVACAAALPGNAQAGQPCNRLWHAGRLSDCAADSFCNTVGVCPGVCQRFAQVNESCDNLHPCRLDLLCGTADGRCHARPGAGDSCVNLDNQVAFLPELTVVIPCPEHHYCSPATLKCTPEVPDGHACMPAEGGCHGYCATASLNTPGTCVAVGGPGEGCTAGPTAAVRAFNGQLSLGEVAPCGYGLECEAGSCRDTLGEACDDAVNRCAAGAICGKQMTCQVPPPRATADCHPGTVCGHPGEPCCDPVTVALEAPYVSGGCASGASCGASGLCP
jgi:hypothetical protein